MRLRAMPLLPDTTERVRHATAHASNRRIAARTRARIACLAERPELIDPQLRALEREWDTERVLEANAATLALTGAALGLLRDRRFLALPLAVAAFLLQHALQGWCPPLPLLRRLGVRTAREIAEERAALKALRGDFDAVPSRPGAAPRDRAEAAWRAARR
ncbi:hypothetical protein [Falsiroseomonas sp. CW058]|uniref:hypothetical protein n=1 Tax=Falsiroseomonas sp. CW058 TaxID=3388664 RepID=UPI003D31AEE9